MSYVENGNANAEFFCSNEKANIFLIGDSIRLGYCATTKAELADAAEVFYVADNCRSSQNIIFNLMHWKNRFDAAEKVDLVHFNCGHWDAAHWNGAEYSLTGDLDYERNIRMIIRTIRKLFPNAKIVMATTTPMNPDGSQGNNPRTTAELQHLNEIAVKVAGEEQVPVNDLFAFAAPWGSEAYVDSCHYTPEAFADLGKEVARVLREYI